jgi:hypothetical protein
VKKLSPLSQAVDVLRVNDVVTHIAGQAIADDCSLAFRDDERICMQHAFRSKHIGDIVRMDILRDGKPLAVEYQLGHCLRKVPSLHGVDCWPSYFIYGAASAQTGGRCVTLQGDCTRRGFVLYPTFSWLRHLCIGGPKNAVNQKCCHFLHRYGQGRQAPSVPHAKCMLLMVQTCANHAAALHPRCIGIEGGCSKNGSPAAPCRVASMSFRSLSQESMARVQQRWSCHQTVNNNAPCGLYVTLGPTRSLFVGPIGTTNWNCIFNSRLQETVQTVVLSWQLPPPHLALSGML